VQISRPIPTFQLATYEQPIVRDDHVHVVPAEPCQGQDDAVTVFAALLDVVGGVRSSHAPQRLRAGRAGDRNRSMTGTVE
jgi:hypothetical protein